jgi:excisionase family DNA binding protein
MVSHEKRTPSVELTAAQRQALVSFNTLLTTLEERPQRVIIIDASGQEIEVPSATLDDLLPAVAAATKTLTISAEDSAPDEGQELTTTQAALWLQISRQYLVDLLKAGAIPYTRVGTHHRIRVGDLIAFKARQRSAIDEMTHLGEELGYDA